MYEYAVVLLPVLPLRFTDFTTLLFIVQVVPLWVTSRKPKRPPEPHSYWPVLELPPGPVPTAAWVRPSHCLRMRPRIGVDDDHRTRRAAALGAVGEERDHVRHVRGAVVVDVDHLLAVFALDVHRQQAAAQRRALADLQRLRAGQLRRGRGQFALEAADARAEQVADVAVRVLGDDDVLAEDRDAAELLLVAIVGDAALFLHRRQHAQRRLRVKADEFRMAIDAAWPTRRASRLPRRIAG